MVKIEKKIPGEKVSYVLRCLWHILEEKKTDHVMKWHDTLNNSFVVASEEELVEFFKTYKDFETSFYSFRRSLYLYGFKKSKNIWFHPNLNKNDKESLSRVIRQKKVSKKKQMEKIRSLTQMFAQSRHHSPFPHMFMQQMFSPTPQMPPPSAPGFFPTFPEPKIEKDGNGRNIIIPPTSFNQLPGFFPIHLQGRVPPNPLEGLTGMDSYEFVNRSNSVAENYPIKAKIEPIESNEELFKA